MALIPVLVQKRRNVMYYVKKTFAFAIICFAYATGVREAVTAYCYECEMRYDYRMVIIAKLFGIIISVAMQ